MHLVAKMFRFSDTLKRSYPKLQKSEYKNIREQKASENTKHLLKKHPKTLKKHPKIQSEQADPNKQSQQADSSIRPVNNRIPEYSPRLSNSTIILDIITFPNPEMI